MKPAPLGDQGEGVSGTTSGGERQCSPAEQLETRGAVRFVKQRVRVRERFAHVTGHREQEHLVRLQTPARGEVVEFAERAVDELDAAAELASSEEQVRGPP